MTNCPRCRQPLSRNTASLPGHTILRCQTCRKLGVEVPGVRTEWVDGGPGWLERLAVIVREAEAVRAIVESPEDDPRWERRTG